MTKFEVIVGNVGVVYSGNNYIRAKALFNSYVKQSESRNGGRAAGENVVLLHYGEIKREYTGYLDKEGSDT